MLNVMKMADGAQSVAEEAPMQESFGGRFYPQELLNSGGMSEIWLVTD